MLELLVELVAELVAELVVELVEGLVGEHHAPALNSNQMTRKLTFTTDLILWWWSARSSASCPQRRS